MTIHLACRFVNNFHNMRRGFSGCGLISGKESFEYASWVIVTGIGEAYASQSRSLHATSGRPLHKDKYSNNFSSVVTV